MKTILTGLLAALALPLRAADAPKPAVLMEGFGPCHHEIATVSPEAQKFFDQGLCLVYGFNHEEAIRSFQRASELDPKAVMPLWGVAYSLGPNINMDVDPEHEKAAFEAEQKALALAPQAPAAEKAYVEALAKRYSSDLKADLKKLAADYHAAMGKLAQAYPDDLDAATLYAESAMDLRPWQLWSHDGEPAEGTEEIVATLESVLRKDPSHLGANHYYIHAVEASPHPERAKPSAERLAAGLAPASGHLVHMPAHIQMRTGDYDGAAVSNEKAMEADRRYVAATGASGVYPLMYYNHNVDFLASARAMQGRYEDARKAADELAANVAPVVKDMQMAEFGLERPILLRVAFRRWKEVLSAPAPASGGPMTRAIWHFARAMALSATGKRAAAGKEASVFSAQRSRIPSDALFGLNPASSVVGVAAHVLDAARARARGDRRGSIAHLRRAVAAQDALAYDEPPPWYGSVRETLGAALLSAGTPAEAEKVFREDLARNPGSGRSLFGLWKSLEAQHSSEAGKAKEEYETAWNGADAPLRLEDL
jgi:tetratricopeptide (TPR) repeat protein